MRAKPTPRIPAFNGRIDRPGHFDGAATRAIDAETPVDAADDLGPTTVYYLHDGDHELLYVGITLSRLGLERMQQHAASKPWWTDVAYASMEHFDTRAEAEQREADAITAMNPRHNIAHPRGPLANDYGVRLCACGCRRPAPERGQGATRSGCRTRAHRGQAAPMRPAEEPTPHAL